jgi:glucose-6-phosphate isomerase/transaldolase/glucose-6-phosphate isomerase
MTSIATLKSLCRPYWDEVLLQEPVARLWRRDKTLWKLGAGAGDRGSAAEEVGKRLGWLDLPFSMRGARAELSAFAAQASERGFRDVVLLGMGGSSLSAEVLRPVFPPRKDRLKLHLLDSTVPATVARVSAEVDLSRALFLVSSKSGGTIEVMSLYRYFRGRLQELPAGAAGAPGAGAHFVAVTDARTSLANLAAAEGFWRTFVNPSDIGGRYSALSYFGLVPAALIGADVGDFLARGREMARLCGVETPLEDNPGACLGLLCGCLARGGRDKLTILTSPALSGFGLWAEQLVAESTGKKGRGIIPIVLEPFGPPDAYGTDRFFVYLRLRGEDAAASDAHAQALDQAGFPVIATELKDANDLAGEFFRWEFAIALAGVCLGINPFDQPNVEESKRNTMTTLRDYGKTSALPAPADEGSFSELLQSARPGDYLALMAFADGTPELQDAFAALRLRLLTKRRLPTTLGYGPRFLHSTGQLHKGGPAGGLFVQFTCGADSDIPIPAAPYGFGALAAAQASGDLQSLRMHQRRAIRIHVSKGEELAKRVRSLCEAI